MNETEKPKVVIGINSLHVAQHAAYSNHMGLFFHLGRRMRDYDFIFSNPPRMSIDRMRNMTAAVAIQANAKWLVFIDDDVLVPRTAIERLIEDCEYNNYQIMCANVMIRGYPFDYMMFRWNKEHDGLETLKEVPKNEIIDVDAVGFSCTVIDVEVLRKLTKPYFVTTHNMTEDVFFCIKVQNELPNIKIGCDTGIECGHILWNEIIYESNRKAYTEYYEKRFPNEIPKPESESSEIDRGTNYYKRIKEATAGEAGKGE